jgi:hypothetical protein
MESGVGMAWNTQFTKGELRKTHFLAGHNKPAFNYVENHQFSISIGKVFNQA